MSWPKNNYKTYDTTGSMGNEDQWRAAFNRRFDKDKSFFEPKGKPGGPAGPIDYLQPLRDAKTGAELKRAYYKLIQQYHPDRAGDTAENNNKTKEINSTYSKLKTKHGL